MLNGEYYVPLLHSKRAEVRAIQHLDKATRDRTFPIIVLRPWPRANQLDLALDRVKNAIGSYRYALDLDRMRRGQSEPQPASAQFDALFDASDGFKKYFDLVESDPLKVPVLRDEGGRFTQIDSQLERIDALGRGVVIRIQRGVTSGLDDVLTNGKLVIEDAAFVVDSGWTIDVLSQESWASSIISQITDAHPEAEIITLSSCFPNSFSHISYKGSFSIDDRDLHRNLSRRHNSARLAYGDWGSTRASEERGGGTPCDRIDVARAGEWVSYRQTGDEAGYKVIANRAIKDPTWATAPACWGRYSVECTAAGLPGGITGTERAASCRINMHITSQAAGSGQTIDNDEPYVDSF